MQAVEMQLAQVNERLQAFNFISPFNGMVVYDRGTESATSLVRLADTSSFVAILPLKAHHLNEVALHQPATLQQYGHTNTGKIVAIDNVIQFVDGRQAFYVTLQFPHHPALQTGTFAEISIHTEQVSLVGLVVRKMRFGS
jgi:hypothetical protein